MQNIVDGNLIKYSLGLCIVGENMTLEMGHWSSSVFCWPFHPWWYGRLGFVDLSDFCGLSRMSSLSVIAAPCF